jgi:autotransporter-associated beta strand protein
VGNSSATLSTLTLNSSIDYSYGSSTALTASLITGQHRLVKNGRTLRRWVGANTYTGGTTINSGKLIISADNNLGAVPGIPTVNLTINGGTLQENTGFNMNANRRIAIGPNGATFLENATANFNIMGVIQDAGPGAGALNITATNTGLYVPVAQNTYTGGTHLAAGSRAVINSASIGSATTNDLVSGPFGTGPLYMDGGSQRAPTVTPPAGGWVIGNAVQLTADSAFIAGSTNTLTFTGPVTLRDGTRTITHNAGGNVIFSGTIDDDGSDFGLTLGAASTGRLVLSGVNTYGGGTNIEGGTLNVNADAALGDASGDVAISNGATLQASGTLTIVARTITLGTGGGQIDTNGNNVTLDVGSTVTGSSLTKVGTGTLVLSGTQTYDTLNAEGGTTVINSALGTGTSTINVDSSPGLDADDPVTTAITVNQTLAVLNIGANGTFILDAGFPSPSPAIEAGDSLDPDIETQDGDLVSDGVPAVPEPGAAAMILAGLSTILSFVGAAID